MKLLSLLRRRPAPRPAPVVLCFSMSAELHKADLRKLRGLDQNHPVLGPVLRLLCEVRMGILAAAEAPGNPHPERSVARASGVSSAIQAIVAATRGPDAAHQQTGFGAEEE